MNGCYVSISDRTEVIRVPYVAVRGPLMTFRVHVLGITTHCMRGKLRGPLKNGERMAIQDAIKAESWKTNDPWHIT